METSRYTIVKIQELGVWSADDGDQGVGAEASLDLGLRRLFGAGVVALTLGERIDRPDELAVRRRQKARAADPDVAVNRPADHTTQPISKVVRALGRVNLLTTALGVGGLGRPDEAASGQVKVWFENDLQTREGGKTSAVGSVYKLSDDSGRGEWVGLGQVHRHADQGPPTLTLYHYDQPTTED